jgi:MFS superfamily sulfate permease-like transporter
VGFRAHHKFLWNRHEVAGAFGDIGTDLPLLVALVTTCDLDPASVAVVFGLLQIATGWSYGLPMPVQPLKAMAVLMLTGGFSPGILAAGGIVVGAVMLLLALTGFLSVLGRWVPKAVVRGLQLGLGASLAMLSFKQYTWGSFEGTLALGVVFLGLLVLGRQRHVPPALGVVGLGVLVGVFLLARKGELDFSPGFYLPQWVFPSPEEFRQGALLLALPQIALSLGNSILATSQATEDLFPGRGVSPRRLGITYGLMNLLGPWLGGVPVCHGCGGLVGFYGFGARSGAAPVLYGAFYLGIGLFFAPSFGQLIEVFPLPLLGAVLLFEALGLMMLSRDVAKNREDFWVSLAVAVAALSLPNGYLVGLVGGILLAALLRCGWARLPGFGADGFSL